MREKSETVPLDPAPGVCVSLFCFLAHFTDARMKKKTVICECTEHPVFRGKVTADQILNSKKKKISNPKSSQI